jgi:TonB family protein
MYKRLFATVLLLACCSVAIAGSVEAVRKQVEVSMMVNGTIDIDVDGRVTSYAIDHKEAYSAGVLQLLAQNTPRWRFEPVLVDGQPHHVRTAMRVRLVAKQIEGTSDGYEISIRSARFGGGKEAGAGAGTPLAALKLDPPVYPDWARRIGVQGTVYVVVRIGADGRVEDRAAEQTNLTVLGSENEMGRWRQGLERSALLATRRWTFRPPTNPEEAAKGHWYARVPVSFVMRGPGEEGQPLAPGKWESYVPGPRHTTPWRQPRQMAADTGVDAGEPGSIQQLDTGLRLLTALDAN